MKHELDPPTFLGAWLTDIDDTLLPSGEAPDQAWIHQFSRFLADMKANDVAWAGVSGVALEKMGPRLLFRLPKEVLSHVLYYGGEGSNKHYYDPDSQTWRANNQFQHFFSDAQALVAIGRERFSYSLANSLGKTVSDSEIQRRLANAESEIEGTQYCGMPSLVDELQLLLAEKGYDPAKAETYFRGGAISWMMFGDISAEQYKGEHESLVRQQLHDHLKQRLAELNNLKDVGETGVHMPYPHATRGIKLVLMGNDKGRAAEDLIQHEGICPDRLLFTGNEIYEGGNDYSVERVAGVTLLSVGEREDPGVINGGVQISAMEHWMQWVANRLESGKSWKSILNKIPSHAQDLSLKRVLDSQRRLALEADDWKTHVTEKLSLKTTMMLYQRYAGRFRETRKKLIRAKKVQWSVVARLATVDHSHYDQARKAVQEILSLKQPAFDADEISGRLKQMLLPEIKSILQSDFIDHIGFKPKKVARKLASANTLGDLPDVIENLLSSYSGIDKQSEKARALSLLENWQRKIDQLVTSFSQKKTSWQQSRKQEQALIENDPELAACKSELAPEKVYRYLRWLAPRIDPYPHLKDLDKPTIVLVSGTSGAGKSTISQTISKSLGIPTGFSSDVASRSVMRKAVHFLLGQDTASGTFPELYGSSFEEDNLDWFYAHSLLTMVGVIGNIDRLIKENISAVIDGVALIPGTLPEKYYERANIVWITVSLSDQEQHYQRLGMRSETGVERGGSERYREQFSIIRRNHDRLVDMAETAGSLVIDNSGDIGLALEQVLQRVADPYADRGLPVEDPVRDRVQRSLQERTVWEVQRAVDQPQ